VKFLVDANLPPALARWIEALGHEAIYVEDVLSSPILDGTIWRYAVANGCVIVSKDSDFVDLSARPTGPQVVWVRCGNLKLRIFEHGSMGEHRRCSPCSPRENVWSFSAKSPVSVVAFASISTGLTERTHVRLAGEEAEGVPGEAGGNVGRAGPAASLEGAAGG